MISPRTALLPLLLLLSATTTAYAGLSSKHSGLSNIYRREEQDTEFEDYYAGLGLTPDEIKRIEELANLDPGVAQCAEKCGNRKDGEERSYLPLCAIGSYSDSGEERIEDVINAYSCLCSDRQYVDQTISCLVKECGGNSTSLEYVLGSQYAMCRLYAKTHYPRPEVFLNELCLLDDIKVTVPTDVPLVKYVWPDYTFAKEWPEQTATTQLPTGTSIPEWTFEEYLESQPKWTCTPTPLSEDESESETQNEDKEEEETKDDTSSNKGNNTTPTTKDDDNGVSGRQGMMGMAAVVAAVAGVAVFL